MIVQNCKKYKYILLLNTLSAVTTIKPPRLPPTYTYILVASGGILLLLIVALVAIPYILWKKRVLWIMKIVYKFQTPVEVGRYLKY